MKENSQQNALLMLEKVLRQYVEFEDFESDIGSNRQLSELLDSFEVLNLLMEVETTFSIKLKPSFFYTEELQTINNILTELIDKK